MWYILKISNDLPLIEIKIIFTNEIILYLFYLQYFTRFKSF